MMNVLFVSSGNAGHARVSPFILAQGESLREAGVAVSYFSVTGRGAAGYLKNVTRLRAHLRTQPVDLIHAHYSLCGWVAVLAAAGGTPVVLSLMGDDAQGTFTGTGKITLRSRLLTGLTWLIQPFVRAIIYKSANLGNIIYRKKAAHLIPNGVRLDQFRIYEGGCRAGLGLEPGKRYVLFLGNPLDPNKNIALARAAVRLLDLSGVELLPVHGVSHETVVRYLNAVDVLVLCSFGEGSPNVVKEAMACNCPLVATAVGDVAWVTGDTPGCYLASFDAADFAAKLRLALDFAAAHGRTRGRDRIVALGLDATSVARRIIAVYDGVSGG